jgi:hypothetical protein
MEAGALQWLRRKKVPIWFATVLLWILKMLTMGVLLYFALWVGFIILMVLFIAWRIRNASINPDEEWAIGEQAEHKKSVFYDPINYNDTDDPRFDK